MTSSDFIGITWQSKIIPWQCRQWEIDMRNAEDLQKWNSQIKKAEMSFLRCASISFFGDIILKNQVKHIPTNYKHWKTDQVPKTKKT